MIKLNDPIKGRSATDAKDEADLKPRLADDLLIGAEEIASFIYGDATERRKIYHLVNTGCLPVFRLGSMVCARKSTLIEWIGEQETGR